MADNTEESEGGSGQRIETGNMEILMKSMADLREHQRLLEERIGIFPPEHNSGGTSQTSNQGDMIMPVRNQNQPGYGIPPDPEKAEEWLQNAEHVLEHVSNDRGTWVKLVTYRFRGPSRDW
ncbi:hypothetical protein MKW98_003163 [Papaver atlanticum]|uniref:Uncharacterized protein n=1 Tax=Papaver atlanticum TaxID=357466 RepID=A0AAD4TEX8_9MAGN|nr:hypothetical protein MKW98_003163 [Papaver atlanticum]